MVAPAGIEPARYCYHGILSPTRLPVPPRGHMARAKRVELLSTVLETGVLPLHQALVWGE